MVVFGMAIAAAADRDFRHPVSNFGGLNWPQTLYATARTMRPCGKWAGTSKSFGNAISATTWPWLRPSSGFSAQDDKDRVSVFFRGHGIKYKSEDAGTVRPQVVQAMICSYGPPYSWSATAPSQDGSRRHRRLAPLPGS